MLPCIVGEWRLVVDCLVELLGQLLVLLSEVQHILWLMRMKGREKQESGGRRRRRRGRRRRNVSCNVCRWMSKMAKLCTLAAWDSKLCVLLCAFSSTFLHTTRRTNCTVNQRTEIMQKKSAQPNHNRKKEHQDQQYSINNTKMLTFLARTHPSGAETSRISPHPLSSAFLLCTAPPLTVPADSAPQSRLIDAKGLCFLQKQYSKSKSKH